MKTKVLKKMIITAVAAMLMLLTATAVMAEGDNLALGKKVECTGEQSSEGNYAKNIVDGNYDTRWSVQYYPKSVTVDLGQEYYLGYSLLYPHEGTGRSYKYEISVSNDGRNFTVVSDRSDNTDKRKVFLDDLGGEYARYVRLTVTDGTAGDKWISIAEFEIYPVEAEANWALGGKVIDFSKQQVDNENSNYAQNAIDGDLDTRWAAQYYPNYIVVDLGRTHTITRTELVPNLGRAYQYKIEVSEDSVNYALVVDKTNNNTSGEVFVDEITPINARFVKLTVTGHADSQWVNIPELRIFGTYYKEAAPVSNVKITKSGNTITATATSTSALGGTVDLIAVVFDGDKMVEMAVRTIDLGEYGEGISGSLTLSGSLSGKTVEAFIWNNDAEMLSCSDTFVF